MDWSNVRHIESFSYKCGHCGEDIASDKGYFTDTYYLNKPLAYIYICHKCKKPTYINIQEGEQSPGAKYGKAIESLPDDIDSLYNEARRSYSAAAYSCTVMCCRKILMHVAVSKGAAEGMKFLDYVKYLSDKNIITTDADKWVDSIRKSGNIANHEIKINEADEAKEMIDFIQMLLMLVYEFPGKVSKIS